MIVKTSIPWPDAVSRSDADLIASTARTTPSSTVRPSLYERSRSPRM